MKRLLFALVFALSFCTAPQAGENLAGNREADEMMATLINMNGKLCAKVISVRRLDVDPKKFEVRCIEYRGGDGTIDYIVDTGTGLVHER